jgi:hypothetical protein
MSGRMDWDRVNRENRAARSASANAYDWMVPSSVSPLEWDSARWNRLRSAGWTSEDLSTRTPGKRSGRKAARHRPNRSPRADSSTRHKARPFGDVGDGYPRAWVDHRGVMLHGSEFAWSISCGCGKHLGKRGIRNLQDLFNCFRSHVGSTDRKALLRHRPYVTNGQEALQLNCSCDQMTTEFTDLSQAALRWLEMASQARCKWTDAGSHAWIG